MIRWAAVGYGAAAGLCVAALSYFIALVPAFGFLPGAVGGLLFLNRMLGILSYAVAGAVAGRFAGENAMVHGALAGLGSGIAGHAAAFTLALVLSGSRAINPMLANSESRVGWLVVGIAIAAVAGALAAAIRQRAS